MTADFDTTNVRHRAVGEDAELREGRATPGRDEESPIRRKRDAIRIMVGGDALRDLARRGIHNGVVIADILCRVDELSLCCYGDARGITGAGAVRSLCLRQYKLVLERRCTV